MGDIDWKIVGPAIAVVVALLVGGALLAKKKRETTIRVETPMGTFELDAAKVKNFQDNVRAAQNAPKVVTLAEFNQIRQGMTYGDVVKIIGANGEQGFSSKSQFGSMESYTWNNEGGGFIGGSVSVTFNDGRVSGMTQMGLK